MGQRSRFPLLVRQVLRGAAMPIVLATTLAGCGGTSHGQPALAANTVTATSAASTEQPQSAAGPYGEVAEDLTFSGDLSGHMAKAHRGDMYVCAGGEFVHQNPNTTGQLAAGPFVGAVGGKEVQMSIVRIDYHGPGAYDASGVSFDVGADKYYKVTTVPGSLTVSPGGRGGKVTMDLAANAAPAVTVGHVQGTWQCPDDPVYGSVPTRLAARLGMLPGGRAASW
jgi:hypothetical protein